VADYDVTLSESLMPDLLERPKALAQVVEAAIQQVLEAQMSEHRGADRYERSEDRAGYRNGYRERQLYTRVGTITLRVPQTREGGFSSEIFVAQSFHHVRPLCSAIRSTERTPTSTVTADP
jgi:putative transposase